MSAAPEGLLDISVVIGLADVPDPDQLPETAAISAATLAELSVGPLVTDDPTERAARQAHLQQAEADFDPIPFDTQCARAFGRVTADLRASGRKPAARAFDALIAATALAKGLPVFTFNAEDFAHISGLDVRAIHPPTPGA